MCLKSPPASYLLKKAAGIAKGSGEPNKEKVGKVTRTQVEEIAKTKDGRSQRLTIWRRPERSSKAPQEIWDWRLSVAKHRKELSGKRRNSWTTEEYQLDEAISLLKKLAFAKFDESVDIACRLGVESQTFRSDGPRNGGSSSRHRENVSGFVSLPAVKRSKKRKKPERIIVGGEELIEKIAGGWTDFDVVIATPDMMRGVGKLGRILGPTGLMPNPKSGTVTFDIKKAVEEIKAGRVEFRVDKTADRAFSASGKSLFPREKLLENIVHSFKPSCRPNRHAAKGKYVRKYSYFVHHGTFLQDLGSIVEK